MKSFECFDSTVGYFMGKQRWHGDTCVVHSSINHDDLICPALGCLKFGRLPILEWLVPVSGYVRAVFLLFTEFESFKVDQLRTVAGTPHLNLSIRTLERSPQ